MEYGLIGKTLGHSFSKIVHEALTDYGYELYPLPTEEEFHDFMKVRNFRGINVTIPYKQDVIPYCESLDPKAQAIGAVNTIVNRGGKLYGYNTDYDGFLYQCQKIGVDFRGKTLLILGTGGTFKTISAVAQGQGVGKILVASRQGGQNQENQASQPQYLSYEAVQEAQLAQTVDIIINTSPVGMFPHLRQQLLSLEGFPNLTAVLDVVYNPLCSLLIQSAQAKGIAATGGLPMLVAQAKYAAEHFTQTPIPDQAMDKVFGQIAQRQSNLVLIGMPSCGKSTLGRKVAQSMGREFIDLDEAVQKKAQKSIPEIFAQEGEEAFRQLETEICWEYGVGNGMVISTGGGVVTRPENIQALGSNGIFVHVTRSLAQLDIGNNRPLSQSKEDVARLYHQRFPIYEALAHITLENDQAVQVVSKKIQEAYYEIFHTVGS